MSAEGGAAKSLFKSRAENFARHLQSRLRSLSESEDGSTWNSAGDPTSLSSSSENETFFEIDSNVTSPAEEITEPDFTHTNRVDNLGPKSDSIDEQFYDTLDPDGDSVPCRCKPVPLAGNLNKKEYHPNGDVGKSYSDAELSSATCNGCVGLQESQRLINCNGCVIHINEGDDGTEDHIEIEITENTSIEEQASASIENKDNLQSELKLLDSNSEQKVDSESSVIDVSVDAIDNYKSGLRVIEEPTDNQIQLNERDTKMNERGEVVDEGKLSLSDLLQVIHKELKLEGKQSNGPEISVSEAPESAASKPSTETDDDEEEDIETRRLRFRRCSSLKSGKTPPGTPGRKKIVRFADVLGLDLADVKTFLDEVPTIPKSAYEDLCGMEPLPTVEPIRISPPSQERSVIPLFQQPGGHPNFIDKIRELNVCLENAVVTDPSLFAITGTVRVKNIDYHKSVHIRYTLNSWKSFADLQARYVPNSCDGFSDKFTFLLYAHTLVIGQRLEFAVRFQARGLQFWDNNGGVNYVFQCVGQDNPCMVLPVLPPSPTESWPIY